MISSLGYLKYQRTDIRQINQLIIYFHGYIKNLKQMILMQVNIDFFVNLMICHMVRRGIVIEIRIIFYLIKHEQYEAYHVIILLIINDPIV